ncbi:alpha/beta hydrolase [Nocardia sp. NPDC048505]|uniref:alpha/beta hydrolase n=1 Tax=unclassified Nocardia TaxID=2637762 RepID=UPI0033F8DBB3
MRQPAHAHLFRGGTAADRAPLVLLHGSDGSESDLLPLAEDVAPGSPLLGLRGAVAMPGGYGFFRRLPDRRVDEADLSARVPVLADFIENACAGYGLERPLAIGFSNGAIMAAALLLSRPGLLAGAILFRPLSPFATDPPGRVDGIPVLIADAVDDDRRAPGHGARLAERLRLAGANVTHRVLPGGHPLTLADRELARDWLRRSDRPC